MVVDLLKRELFLSDQAWLLSQICSDTALVHHVIEESPQESLVAKTLTKWVNVGAQKTLSHGKEHSMGNAESRCSRLCCVSASPANLLKKYRYPGPIPDRLG